MEIAAMILVFLVGVEHFYIMGLEMFFSSSKTAQRTFGSEKSFLKQKKVQALMGNQGLYNGFLAAGIMWSLFLVPAEFAVNNQLFFLICIIIAAIYGSITANKAILLKQGLPAILATILLLLAFYS